MNPWDMHQGDQRGMQFDDNNRCELGAAEQGQSLGGRACKPFHCLSAVSHQASSQLVAEHPVRQYNCVLALAVCIPCSTAQ